MLVTFLICIVLALFAAVGGLSVVGWGWSFPAEHRGPVGHENFKGVSGQISSRPTGATFPASKWPSFQWLKYMGVILTTYKSWDDPQSRLLLLWLFHFLFEKSNIIIPYQLLTVVIRSPLTFKYWKSHPPSSIHAARVILVPSNFSQVKAMIIAGCEQVYILEEQRSGATVRGLTLVGLVVGLLPGLPCKHPC